MFAAAAVAAAAALTAISTTSTSQKPEHQFDSSRQQTSNDQRNNQHSTNTNERPKPYISWTQYANQRRNSLQRRKYEISKRLEKVNANNPNNPNNFNQHRKEVDIRQFQPTNKTNTCRINQKPTPQQQLKQKQQQLKNLIQEKGNLNLNFTEDENWLKNLSVNVCNEFIKIQEINSQIRTQDLDNIDLTNPTYSNFNLITSIKNELNGGQNQFDINEISEALLEYLQSQNIPLVNQDQTDSANPYQNNNNNRNQPANNNSNRPSNRKQEEDLNYLLTHRWDPKWLKSLRKSCCIPFAIITLIFLIFTNISSNWIRLDDDNQRAGLWTICNKTRIDVLEDINLVTTTTSLMSSLSNIDYSSTTSVSYLTSIISSNYEDDSMQGDNKGYFSNLNDDSVTLLNENNTTGSAEAFNSNIIKHNENNNSISTTRLTGLMNKIKKAKDLFDKANQVEDCYSKFFLKEDAHLAILALALVALLFHFIGLVLLFIGFIFTTSSNRTLYFFHSAGECLVTSALMNGLHLLAFVSLVSSQIEQSYTYGYCFYINLIISITTFCSSILLYLDDMVNEYRIWNLKTSEANHYKTSVFMPT